MENTRNKKILAWLVVSVLYFGIYGYHLQRPDTMYYDEVYFVKTAREIIHLNGYTDTVQPPFGKLLIAFNILVFGDHSWAWRMASIVSGFGCLVMLYAITKLLTKSSRAAFFAALLFSFDCVSFTQARIAMLNSTMYFLMLLSLWFLMKHVVTREWKRATAFFWSGVCFGLAVGTRLIGLSIVVMLFVFYRKLWTENKKKKALLKDTVYFLMITPLIIYESAYLIIPFIRGFDWSSILKLQYYMMKYHLTLKQGHTYGSEWWSWPLMMRPIWYYYHSSQVNGIPMMRGILCIGNPLIFWMIPVVMVFAIVQLLKTKTWVYLFVVTGFFTQWLQWSPVTRVKFFHYIYTAIPFVAIALALALDKLWQSGQIGKVAVALYLLTVIGMFIYWYPLLNGMLITDAYFRQHMWFKSWI